LKTLDPNTQVSDNILADMLLNGARLDRTEKLMIMTTVNNKKSFELIATALMEQHSKVHIEEASKRTDDAPPRGRGRGGPARRWRDRPSAFIASVDDPERREDLDEPMEMMVGKKESQET